MSKDAATFCFLKIVLPLPAVWDRGVSIAFMIPQERPSGIVYKLGQPLAYDKPEHVV